MLQDLRHGPAKVMNTTFNKMGGKSSNSTRLWGGKTIEGKFSVTVVVLFCTYFLMPWKINKHKRGKVSRIIVFLGSGCLDSKKHFENVTRNVNIFGTEIVSRKQITSSK